MCITDYSPVNMTVIAVIVSFYGYRMMTLYWYFSSNSQKTCVYENTVLVNIKLHFVGYVSSCPVLFQFAMETQ